MTEHRDDGKKISPWAYILIGLAGIGMLAIGVPMYFSGGRGQADAAEVNGQRISQYQLNNAASQLSQNLNTAVTPELRKNALEQLIGQLLLQQHAMQSGYELSNHSLEQMLRQRFPTVKDYEAALSNMHTTAKSFEAGIRAQQTQQNYYQMLSISADASRLPVDTLLSQMAQQRDVEIVSLPLAPFAAKVSVDDAALAAYFDSHQADYRTPEQVDIQYVLLDAGKLQNTAGITPEELAAHSLRAGKYIIFDKPEEAEKTAAAIQNGSLSFDSAAKEVDAGKIAGQTGRLDKHAKGKGVSKEADDALFAIGSIGGVSPLFDTEYGKMLIQLDAEEAAGDAIKQQILAERNAESYTKLANSLFDAAQNGAPISQIGQEAHIEPIALTGLTAGTQAPAWLQNQQLQNQLFGKNAAEVNKTALPVEIDANRSLFFVVTKREAPRQQMLDEVRPAVEKAYRAAEAMHGQQALAQQVQDGWKAGKEADAAAIAAAGGSISRYQGISQIIKPEASGLPAGLYMPVLEQTEKTAILNGEDGGLAVSRITAVRAGKASDVPEDMAKIIEQQQRYAASQQMLAGIEAYLRSKADISINQAVLEAEAQ